MERLEHPQIAFQFEHQQLQEYYASLEVRDRLVALNSSNEKAKHEFLTEFVNRPSWEEPLRMIAGSLASESEDPEHPHTLAGVQLVEMAAQVDLLFAAELARVCGKAVWTAMRGELGKGLRACLISHNGAFRDYALAGMLATGSSDFADVLVPLLSDPNQQHRLHDLRLSPDLHLSSIGERWQDVVRHWPSEARKDLVRKVLHNRFNEGVVEFAACDPDESVREAAADELFWNGWDDALVPWLERMSDESFSRFADRETDRLPPALRNRAIELLRTESSKSIDPSKRLITSLRLIEMGESGLTDSIKAAMTEIGNSDLRATGVHFLEPALKYLKDSDPELANRWLSQQSANGKFYDYEYWLPKISQIPSEIVLDSIEQLSSKDFDKNPYRGLVAVVGAAASAREAELLFTRVKALRVQAQSDPVRSTENQHRWKLIHQMSDAFRALSPDVKVQGILSSVQRDATMLPAATRSGLAPNAWRTDTAHRHSTTES